MTGASAPDPADDAPRRLVVLAASAGGLHALSVVLGGLPADFPAALIVVQHRLPRHDDGLIEILRARTALSVRDANPRRRLRPGVVHVAPPNLHVQVLPGAMLALDDGPPIEHVRPSANILFASAAAALGEAVIAVVLTGRGSDGADGVRAVRGAGGVVIAQDPATAEAAGMPLAAIATGCVAQIAPLEAISAALEALVQGEPATP